MSAGWLLPSTPLTCLTATRSKLHYANLLATVFSESALQCFQLFHVPNLIPIFCFLCHSKKFIPIFCYLCHSKVSVQILGPMSQQAGFLGWEVVIPLKQHPSWRTTHRQVVLNCLFNIFTVGVYMWRPSPPSTTWGHAKWFHLKIADLFINDL